MNDYWLDPPDEPEPPICCADYMDVQDDGVCVCPTCGARIERDVDPAWEGFETVDLEPIGHDETGDDECPHGNPWSECDACDHASDLAYDAARERRWR